MASEPFKSNIHRFRVRRPSRSTHLRRSASPPPPPPHASQEIETLGAAAARDIPACDRCRSFKKKCSRTFPSCTLCTNAGEKCSLAISASSTDAQTHHLRARVEWLTQLINTNFPVGSSGIETFDTGTDLAPLGPQSVPVLASDGATASSRGLQQQNLDPSTGTPGSGPTPDSAHLGGPGPGSVYSSAATTIPLNGLSPGNPSVAHAVSPGGIPGTLGTSLAPPLEAQTQPARTSWTARSDLFTDPTIARRFVDAYFRHIHRAYPFMNRAKVLRDLERLGGNSPEHRKTTDSTLLFLIMVLGCTTLQRSGQLPSGTVASLDVSYADILQECLMREDIESIQILILLALYSMFDPTVASTWSISGMAARKAMSLGLSRRASEDKSISATDVELRHRVFWSVWVLDRVMAITRGLPIALTDENIDVPLPGLTIDEFASPDRQNIVSVLQTHRHIIHLRQLEGRILEQVHTRKQSEILALSQTDRQAIQRDIRCDIENWYSYGCLLAPMEPDTVPIHGSVAWLSARYYHLLIFLHYPCPFNSFGAMGSAAELLRFTQRHLQSTMVLLQQRQLPLNRVTLGRIFPIGLLLIHTFINCADDGVPFPARNEVDTIISIFEAFPEAWSQARQGAQVFRQFAGIIAGSMPYTPPHVVAFGTGASARPRESYRNLLKPVISAALSIVRDALGRSSCFSFDLYGTYGTSSTAAVDERRQSTYAPSVPSQLPMMAVMDGDASHEDYGWGALEFGFT